LPPVALALAHASGLITPRPWLEVRAVQFHAEHTFTETIRLHNTDWIGESVTAIASATPGVVARPRHPASVVPAGGSVLVTVDFRVVDCRRAVRTQDPSLRLTFHRPWGSAHRTEQIQQIDFGTVAGSLVRNEELFMDGVLPWSCQH
jgi:hypothetical protein